MKAPLHIRFIMNRFHIVKFILDCITGQCVTRDTRRERDARRARAAPHSLWRPSVCLKGPHAWPA